MSHHSMDSREGRDLPGSAAAILIAQTAPNESRSSGFIITSFVGASCADRIVLVVVFEAVVRAASTCYQPLMRAG